MRLKNRVIMAPMGTNYGTTDGFSTDRDTRYYGERARGGVALIVTEAMNVSAGARNHTSSLCVFHDRFIPGFGAVVRAIHDHGALAVAQLNHRGQLLRRSVLGMEPVGPTAGRHPATGEPVRGLRVDEIRRHPAGLSRRITARCGGPGMMPSRSMRPTAISFISSLPQRFNRRDDQYGGSRENRMRLLLETVRTHPRRASRCFPVIVRLSATEYVDGGYPEEDIVALAQALEREPASSRSTCREARTRARSCRATASSRRRFLGAVWSPMPGR